MTKTLAKILAKIIRWGAILYVLYIVFKPCIELYHKYGWIAIPVWIFMLSLLCGALIVIIKVLDYLDNKAK